MTSWSLLVSWWKISSRSSRSSTRLSTATPSCAAIRPTSSAFTSMTVISSFAVRTIFVTRRHQRGRQGVGVRCADHGVVVRGQVVQRHRRHQPAAFDDDDVVDGRRNLGEQVTRKEHRPTLRGETTHRHPHPGDAIRVEAVQRLVEEDHRRVTEQCAGQRETLAHPHRVAADAAVGGRLEVDRSQHLADPAVGDAGRSGHHLEVLFTAAARVEDVRVDRCADLPNRVGELGVRPAGERHDARCRRGEPEHHPHRRRLARSVPSEEARDTTAGHPEGEVVDRSDRAVALGQVVNVDGAHARIVSGADWGTLGADLGAPVNGSSSTRSR